MPVIGFLHGASPVAYARMLVAFREGLKEAGYIEDVVGQPSSSLEAFLRPWQQRQQLRRFRSSSRHQATRLRLGLSPA
jgi:hypothetical protein